MEIGAYKENKDHIKSSGYIKKNETEDQTPQKVLENETNGSIQLIDDIDSTISTTDEKKHDEYINIINNSFNINLMTFNVWWGCYGNKIPHKNLDWSSRKNSMNQMLTDTNPTIIGLQELIQIHLSHFPQTKYKIIQGECREKDWNEFNSILYDPLILTLKQSETFWLSNTPYTKYSKLIDGDHPRIAL
eukprot:UN09073